MLTETQLDAIRKMIEAKREPHYRDPRGAVYEITRIAPDFYVRDGAPPVPALRLKGGVFAVVADVAPEDIVFIAPAFYPSDLYPA